MHACRACQKAAARAACRWPSCEAQIVRGRRWLETSFERAGLRMPRTKAAGIKLAPGRPTAEACAQRKSFTVQCTEERRPCWAACAHHAPAHLRARHLMFAQPVGRHPHANFGTTTAPCWLALGAMGSASTASETAAEALRCLCSCGETRSAGDRGAPVAKIVSRHGTHPRPRERQVTAATDAGIS